MEVTSCGKSEFSYHRELLLKERTRSLFPLRKFLILKRAANEEYHCLIQKAPFDMRKVSSVLATLLTETKRTKTNNKSPRL